MVALGDLETYVHLVTQHLLVDGTLPAVAAFREGFNDVAPVRALRVFFAHDLAALVSSADEHGWDPDRTSGGGLVGS
jgi:hypothetical protein